MTAFAVPENLAFDNYSDLSDAVAEWMDRNDLTGATQQMIALAEARMRRLLQPLLRETSASVTAVNGKAALPSDCDIIRFIDYGGGELQQVAPNHGRQFPSEDESSSPRGFTLEENYIKLWPGNDVTITVIYQPKLVSLSEASPSNWLLSQHPDCYFYGAMLFAEGFVANDARASLFKSLWDESLSETMMFLSRQRRVSTRLRGPAVVV